MSAITGLTEALVGAEGSAAAAAQSAQEASESAGTAKTQADRATNSGKYAGGKAKQSSDSATAAANSASAAAGSASIASSEADRAKQEADRAAQGGADHSQLTNRDAENQHPMSAITGLSDALGKKLSNEETIPSGLLPLASNHEAGVICAIDSQPTRNSPNVMQLARDTGSVYKNVGFVQAPWASMYGGGMVNATPSDSTDGVPVEINNADHLLRVPHDTQKLDAAALASAIDTALTQAKASGEFDGKDGATGPQGPAGLQGLKGDTGLRGPEGKAGPKGDPGMGF